MRDMDRTGDIKLKLKSEYEKEIRILLAGKVAEEIKYGEHTQGCVNDIEKATELIYRMVTSYGFDNEALFNINKLEDNGIQNALKNDIIEKCNKELKLYNEQTEKMLREHIEKLDKLVDRLYEEKTIVSPSLDMLS